MKIILASASPRRRELMKYIVPDFETFSADVDETLPYDVDPSAASEYLAELKALAAAEKFPDDLVIGCDTTVICGRNILGKPKNKEECIEFINILSGRTHRVITGCSIIYGKFSRTFSEVTDVSFRSVSEKEADEYTATKEPYDKAGGYGIQGGGSQFITNIDGDFFNVVGLPVTRLYQELKKFARFCSIPL